MTTRGPKMDVLINYLAQQEDVLAAYLFGSRAAGKCGLAAILTLLFC